MVAMLDLQEILLDFNQLLLQYCNIMSGTLRGGCWGLWTAGGGLYLLLGLFIIATYVTVSTKPSMLAYLHSFIQMNVNTHSLAYLQLFYTKM